MNFGQTVHLNESRTYLKKGHVRPKTRLSGQMIEKPCVGSGGHIVSRKVIKIGLIWVMLGQKLDH